MVQMGQGRDGVLVGNGQCLVGQRHRGRSRLVSVAAERACAFAADQTRTHRILSLDLVPGSLIVVGAGDANPRGCARDVEEAARGHLVFLRGRGQVHPCGRVCQPPDQSLAVEHDMGAEECDDTAVVGCVGGRAGGGV